MPYAPRRIAEARAAGVPSTTEEAMPAEVAIPAGRSQRNGLLGHAKLERSSAVRLMHQSVVLDNRAVVARLDPVEDVMLLDTCAGRHSEDRSAEGLR